MLKMPSNLDKSDEYSSSQHEQQQHQLAMKNLLFESEQLTEQQYARTTSSNSSESVLTPVTSATEISVRSICTASNPLDRLIKLQERLQQAEFCPAPASAAPFRCSSPKMPLGISPMSKTPSVISSRSSTSFSNNKETISLSSATFACPQSLLNPSSLVLSTYANATQLAGPMAAVAATAPWASSNWQWNAAAAATETAALLNGTYGGGATTATTSAASNANGGWNGAYFGNAFGDLMSNQFGNIGNACFSPEVPQNQQITATLSAAMNQPNANVDVKNSLAKTGEQQRRGKKGNGTVAQKAVAPMPTAANALMLQMPLTATTMAKCHSGESVVKGKIAAKHRPKAGGKIKSGSNGGGSAKAGGSKCECPNCKAGIPNKHNCHIPGCHKVYGKSSHLKAHLKWHKPERTPVTKKRLFDPPNNFN